ncbi:hypothetical protein JTB14_029024 [Gonioctena quinquepunctata]|nr:hypothetical protein JTB14_029024 [Gonioctena quinquepunctata]
MYEEAAAASYEKIEDHTHKLETILNKLKKDIDNHEIGQDRLLASIVTNEFHNLKHIIELTRAMRRQGAMTSCRQHQIPISILDPGILVHDLQNSEVELKNVQQELAISTKDLDKYYQLPLCDCTFSNQKIIIHISIPINCQSHSWELFELITTPFAWFNRTCKIEHKDIFLAVSINPYQESNQIRQISGSGLKHCKPHEDKLCYLPRFSADAHYGPACAKHLYNGASVEEINHHCPMTSTNRLRQ